MLAGRYRLVRRIAAGGMGAVHEAVDERLDRAVAVKVLHEQFVDDPTFADRFRRSEAAVAGCPQNKPPPCTTPGPAPPTRKPGPRSPPSRPHHHVPVSAGGAGR